MPQRTQQSNSPEMLHGITPGMAAVGAAAAAGVFLAGKWLYNNSDKVTLWLDDIGDNMSGFDDHGGGSGGIDRQHPPTVGSVGGKQSSSKRNIPVH